MIRALCVTLGLLLSAAAWAHPAQERLEQTVNTLTRFLVAEQSQLRDDAYLQRRVREIVGDVVDFDAATKLAVGPAWREANRAQRQALTDEFTTLLIRVYGSAMREYTGERVEFLPFREGNRADRAEVRSMLLTGAGPVPVSYKLRDKGQWRIYDIVVDSVSLVTNYRNTFGSEISRGGIDGLINSLRTRNAR